MTELLPLVVTSGFVDGLHPCGFAVLIFFVAFLLSLKRSRKDILAMGALYIAGVFLAYFLIGLGIFKVFSLFPGHFFAQAGAVLLILLGLLNIKDYFLGGTTLRLPKIATPRIEAFIRESTLPAAFAAGFLVGLCAFPCAGGIYVAILGLIAAKLAYWEGLGYLALYNLMFVMPLILVLFFASNQSVLEKLEDWEAKYKKKFKLAFGLTMIALGAYILFAWAGVM